MKLFFQYGVGAWLGKTALVLTLLTASVVTGTTQADPVRVVAFGDSLTQGYGLRAADGFVPQLRGWLEEAAVEVDLVNAGVSGDTTAGGLARIDWTLSPDVEGLIVILGGNDVLRGFDPAFSRQNLAGILAAGRDQGLKMLVVGMTAPGNYGPAFKESFDAIHPELADEYGAAYGGRFFAGLGTDDPAQVLHLMQGDGIHPNPEGVAMIVQTLGPHVVKLVRDIEAER